MEVPATNASISTDGQVLSANTVNPLLQQVLVSQRKSIKGKMRFSNRIAGATRNIAKVHHPTAIDANATLINAQPLPPLKFQFVSFHVTNMCHCSQARIQGGAWAPP